MTLDALAWCRKAGVAVVMLDSDGEIMLVPGSDDARLRRVRAAPPDGMDVEAARLLLRPKLTGHAAILLDRLDDHETARTVSGLADALDDADSVDECTQLEPSAAACYWDTWSRHPATALRFARSDADRVR